MESRGSVRCDRVGWPGVAYLLAVVVWCGSAAAQDAGAQRAAVWLPHPSRFLDRSMTEEEYKLCRQRKDIPKWGVEGHPASDVPPASRALLNERVSVDVNGTVLEALKAVMGQSGRLWLASVCENSADKVAQFRVQDMPLWQALDRLLETYGYDWGFAEGSVVSWPALSPARVRHATPEMGPEAAATTEVVEPIEFAEPTPIMDVMVCFYPTTGWLNGRPTVDVRLRGFRLVGRLAGDDIARGIHQIAAALPAVVQGDPMEGCIAMGAHMWLDRAMRGAEARAAELAAQGIVLEYNGRHTFPLEDRIRALLTPQQWELMDQRGQAVIWFRELPLDVAELWVLAARVSDAGWASRKSVTTSGEAVESPSVDWSRPEDFKAVVFYTDDVQQDPGDELYRVVGRHKAILTVVPVVGGGERGL